MASETNPPKPIERLVQQSTAALEGTLEVRVVPLVLRFALGQARFARENPSEFGERSVLPLWLR